MPILENDQDIPRLAKQAGLLLAERPACHGFLLRRHGLYTWGDTVGRGRTARRDSGVPARESRTRKGDGHMALVRIPPRPGSGQATQDVTLTNAAEITAFLGGHGIDYERWTPAHPVDADAPAEAMLAAYAAEIDNAEGARRLRHRRRHRRHRRHAEPRRDARQVQQRALARRGRSALHRRRPRACSTSIRPSGPVFAIEVEAGRSDPRAARHASLVRSLRRRRIRAIRLFQDAVGLDAALHRERGGPGFEPVCFGPAYVARRMILLDIEGTTTPIAFVTATLVPYARTHLAGYLEQQAERHSTTARSPVYTRNTTSIARAGATVLPWARVRRETHISHG